jgi:hypothetical protein
MVPITAFRVTPVSGGESPRVGYCAAHIHILLLGLVTGMIFGMGYHVFRPFRLEGDREIACHHSSGAI